MPEIQLNIACCFKDNAAFDQIKKMLVWSNFTCERFVTDVALLRTIRNRPFDLILIDIGESDPKDEGFFAWLRCRSGENTPVVVLANKYNAEAVASALDAGADDFIVRPFEVVEVIARLQAVLRRSNKKVSTRAITHAGFTLDRETGIFADRGVSIDLTTREFTMAWLFFSSPGVYISRETISVAIWSSDSDVAGRTIEQHVYKLRKKLQLGPKRGVILRTAYTHGYRLEVAQNH